MKRWLYRGIEIRQSNDGWSFRIGDLEFAASNEMRCRQRVDALLLLIASEPRTTP